MSVEDAGSISAEIRLKLTQMEKDALEAQKKMDAFAEKLKKQGDETGKGFAAGMKKGFNSTEQQAKKLGMGIAKSLSPMMIAVGAAIKIVGSLANGFMNAMMANEKFSKAISDFKSAVGASFANAVKPVSDFFGNIIQKAAESVRNASALREELKRLRGEVDEAAASAQSARVSSLQAAVQEAKAELDKAERNIRQRKGFKNVTEDQLMKNEDYANAKNNQARLQNELAFAMKDMGVVSAGLAAEFEKLGKAYEERNRNTKEWAELNANNADKEKTVNEKRLAAVKEYITGIESLFGKEKIRGSMIETTYNKLKKESSDLEEALNKENTARESNINTAQKEITFDERRKQIMEQYQKGMIEAEAQYVTNLERGMEKTEAVKIMKEQTEQASAKIYADLLLINAEYEHTTEETEAWKDSLEDVRLTLGKIKDESGKPKSENWLANALGMNDKELGYMFQVGDSAISAMGSIADTSLEISRKHAEEQIAVIEENLNLMLEQIDKARQAELEEKGFIEAQSEEEYERQIERAKKSGDEILQYHLERRKEEMEINKKYDAQVKAAEEKAAREKAEIEFRVAKQEYAMQIIQAANSAAMAVMQALAAASPPINFILAGLSGAAAAVQMGLLLSNPPQMPHFADGGIVPGRKADGDTKNIMATAGELILNEAQQERVAGKLESGYTQLTVIMQVDGREMAKTMADVYGSGTVLIPARGIAR